MGKSKSKDALVYHSTPKPGKIAVIPTKRHATQRDLSLAYSPGVAEPCLEIAKDPNKVYSYTSKGNLVAVISNGTAVLGLGDIGPLASKPVMEGKAVLFKIFADIDVFDIEVSTDTVDEFVRTVKSIAPTFGGINLEDIKAPESFEIEERLIEELDIPVMHDDQHGTAIISAAALINALELAKKKIERVKIVINGAGAAAISCAKLYLSLGARPKNLLMLDSKGVISTKRENLGKYKQQFAQNTRIETLEEAMKHADVFVGLSKGGVVDQKMIKSMAKNPIVFALANPDPEIAYKDAIAVRKDIILATGRTDHPNQVNNVLGFPFIFRGALDVRAKRINEEMKIAAVKALAELAKESVPEEVNMAYGNKKLVFGPDYIIPKPFDPRLIAHVSPAVAKAAMDSGVAQEPIKNFAAYKLKLNQRLGLDNQLIRQLTIKAKSDPKRVVFAEADNYKILRAAQILFEEGIAQPILLGNRKRIQKIIEENALEMPAEMVMIDPKAEEQEEQRIIYGDAIWEKRKRKGLTKYEAIRLMRDRNHYGLMMVEAGDADALISGISRNYPNTIKPALQVIGVEDGVSRIAGAYILMTKKGPIFFADCTVNVNPTAEELKEIALLTANQVKKLGFVPRIAMLSYSNFGSSTEPSAKKVSKAVEMLHKEHPGLIVDGEIQANFALDAEVRDELFPFSKLLDQKINTFIFPSLEAGNIAYKILQELAEVEVIGPVLMGLKKSVHVLPLGSKVNEIVQLVTLAVADAQMKSNK